MMDVSCLLRSCLVARGQQFFHADNCVCFLVFSFRPMVSSPASADDIHVASSLNSPFRGLRGLHPGVARGSGGTTAIINTVQLDCGLVRTEGLASRSTEGGDCTEGRVCVGGKVFLGSKFCVSHQALMVESTRVVYVWSDHQTSKV
jgi:hypothetical protein